MDCMRVKPPFELNLDLLALGRGEARPSMYCKCLAGLRAPAQELQAKGIKARKEGFNFLEIDSTSGRWARCF